MVEIYDAHEQGEIVKKWLKENGGAIVMGLVIAFGGLFGFRQWQSWQDSRTQEAHAEFQVMNELLSQGQLDAAVANFENLKADHGKSPYATLAALQMARARLEANQLELAESQYRFVMGEGQPAGLKTIARERLARLLLDQGRPEEALELLDTAGDVIGFEAAIAEVRGDILVQLGRTEDAAAAYRAALDSLESGLGDRAALELKLESLGVPAPEAPAES